MGLDGDRSLPLRQSQGLALPLVVPVAVGAGIVGVDVAGSTGGGVGVDVDGSSGGGVRVAVL